MKKTTKYLSYILIFSAVFFLGWGSGTYYLKTQSSTYTAAHSEASPLESFTSIIQPEQADLTLYWKVWAELQQKYVNETALDKKNMVYGTIKGMVNSLKDPYTEFMTPEETHQFESGLNGTLEGIGAELSRRDEDDFIVIVSPLKGSPAEKAGLLPGDIIYKIDGNLAEDMTTIEAARKIQGPKGTQVTLTILREGRNQPLDISIVRDEIKIESVLLTEKENGIFVIEVREFGEKTRAEFEKALQTISLKEPKGLIIDLRYNGGGYLDSAVDLLSNFLEGKKQAVIIKRREGTPDETLHVKGNASFAKIPLVVLVNQGSASASEIFAGAIQDHKRGIIIGEQTFGKGSVQEITDFKDGSSLRVTIAKWYTPNGKSISDVGITPDIQISLTEEDFKNKKDPQMDEAIKYLKNK